MTQRVAIFIDGSNLYHALDENCGRMDLDFGAFISKLSSGRELFRAYYYNILQDSDRRGHAYQEQQKFLATLYGTSYMEVRLGTSKYRGDVMVEKGVDIMMATDLLQYGWTNKYDTGILVSGDGDFAYAIQTIKNFGRHVEVVSFPGNLSYELSQVADVLTILERSFFDDLWVSGRGQREREDEIANPPLRKRRRRRRPITPNDQTTPPTSTEEPVATNLT
ncbi:NYN domain-containing protein [SAR202 cluster bacterium AD-804-J14_MRT_500m]|nr:NYN domain-containing protein [SAR202 cluster bacterium AD-804-J14_MRT_500m]